MIRKMACMILFAIVSLGGAAARAESPAERLPLDGGWGTRGLWYDGNAEIAKYDAEQVVYRGVRRFEAVLMTVKETMNADLMIKADRPGATPRTIDALKLNMAVTIQTPNYPYHYLVCAQARLDDLGQLLRQTVGSQEWCGNTYKEFTTVGGQARFKWQSYFEREGNGVEDVELGGTAFTEEQLLMTLRSLRFEPGLKFDARVYPGQLTNHVPARTPVATSFEVAEGKPFELKVEGGEEAEILRVIDTWEVTAKQAGGRTMRFVYGRDYPNPLVEFETSDGRKLTLKSLVRDQYWVIKK